MKKIFTKKRIIWSIIILIIILIIGLIVIKAKNKSGNIITEIVKKQDLKRTVLTTGQVVSKTDLSLSFKLGGVVSKINVKEGDKVKAGDILAMLNQNDQLATLTSARGSLAQAQANYNKVLAGASSEDIDVAQKAVTTAQVALDNAKLNEQNVKLQQDTAVKNAYTALLNSTPAAIANSGNISSINPIVSGTYTGSNQGLYNITIYSAGNGNYFQYSGLETGTGKVDTVPQPLGTFGLFLQFPSVNVSGNSWTINIPNTQAANYVTNYSAYQTALAAKQSAIDSATSAVNTAKASLDQAEASLNFKKAQARPADLQAAGAQILSAQGQLQAAQAALENTIIRAPADGTITSVDVKVGELATAMKEVMILQDVGNLHVEANVSEANIADIKPGQTIDITFDSLGIDRHFKAQVQTVNPASTLVSGVVNFLVKASVENVAEIKPGMTANLTILVAEKNNVLSISDRSVLSNGSKKVRLIDDPKKKTFHELEVQTGMQADGGLVEILSGLNEGQEIVSYTK